MKVAVVHDDFIQHGGAERLVLAMLELFPQADLFTILISDQWSVEMTRLGYKIKDQKPKIKNTVQNSKPLYVSWLQKFPLKEKLFRQYYFFYPLAIESFRFDDYDLVISSSARYAHGVLTKPGTIHIAYINSPARFLWQENFMPTNPLITPIINWHRAWDKVAGQRPDYIIANSKTPAERITKCWGREADKIIYPFADLERFTGSAAIGLDPEGSNPLGISDYFLVVSRLNRWKRVDIAVEACRDLGLNLVVVGSGPDLDRLKEMSGPTIKFLIDVDDEPLVFLYDHCRALIMTQEEDFGITSLEAQAAGKPVVAFRRGGALETVLDGVTGIFFEAQTKESLGKSLASFDPKSYLRENCVAQAGRFGPERFKRELEEFTNNALRSR